MLAQLRADGRWHGGEAVVPVSPQRVAAMGAYLLAVERSRRRGGATAPTAREADAAEAEKRTKPTDAVKKEKTALVALMLQHGDEFRVEAGQPAAMAQSFLQRWRLQEDRRLGVARAGRRAAKSHGTPVVKKLDDLGRQPAPGRCMAAVGGQPANAHNYGPHALLAANDAVEPDPAAEKETLDTGGCISAGASHRHVYTIITLLVTIIGRGPPFAVLVSNAPPSPQY